MTIARGWFEAAGFAKGAEVTFELAWTSADGGTKNSATVVVKVVNTRLGEIGSFDLGSEKSAGFSRRSQRLDGGARTYRRKLRAV